MSPTKRIPKLAATLFVLFCLAVLLVKTRSWPLISDATLMHYIVLLIHNGLAPYRDIIDINMPGSYLAELAVITRGLLPYHAGMARHTLAFLLGHAVPSVLLPMAALSTALLIRSRGWRDPVQKLGLLAIGCGLIFFCVQGKAYPYHRYSLLAFAWLLIATQVAPAFASRRESRMDAGLAWAMVIYGVVWFAPACTARALRYDWRSQPSPRNYSPTWPSLEPA